MINGALRTIYYGLKPYLPRRLQLMLRRKAISLMMLRTDLPWPIDERAARTPPDWRGWPQGKRFALVLTHDVDTVEGQGKCRRLVELEQSLGFRSSFNFVIENAVPAELRQWILRQGFEVGVHGLTHNGSLYKSREVFLEQARIINEYLAAWEAVGFRSPAMHHNLSWLHDLDIEYDASTFDTDPFEPQPDGVTTIFPFHVDEPNGRNGYVELPYTIPQDFTVFILMRESTIDTWKKKLDWVREKGGMVLINTHPDYMCFGGATCTAEEYPASRYAAFLEHIRGHHEGEYWHVLPKEMARFWRETRGPSPVGEDIPEHSAQGFIDYQRGAP